MHATIYAHLSRDSRTSTAIDGQLQAARAYAAAHGPSDAGETRGKARDRSAVAPSPALSDTLPHLALYAYVGAC